VTYDEQTCEAFTHRDAVRFTNGREILLQDLRCGQRVDVLSLSSASDDDEPQDRPSVTENRMKELNAAYERLKEHANHIA
jgi:hypothetical protein